MNGLDHAFIAGGVASILLAIANGPSVFTVLLGIAWFFLGGGCLVEGILSDVRAKRQRHSVGT